MPKYTLDDISEQQKTGLFKRVFSLEKLLTILNELAEGQENLAKGNLSSWQGGGGTGEVRIDYVGGTDVRFVSGNDAPLTGTYTSPKDTWEERFDNDKDVSWLATWDGAYVPYKWAKDFIRAEKEASRKEAIMEVWSEMLHAPRTRRTESKGKP